MKFLFAFCVLIFTFEVVFGSVAVALPSKKTGHANTGAPRGDFIKAI
jgi:hypothetical protein